METILLVLVQVAYWLILAFLAVLANKCTGIPLETVGFTLLAVGLAMYSTHRLAHYMPVSKKNWWWKWFVVHTIGHHRLSYPEKDFMHVKYRDNPVDTHWLGTLVYVIPCIVVLFLVHVMSCKTPTLGQTLSSTIVVALALLFEDRIHAEIHKQGSFLERYQWFQMLRSIHKTHHSDEHRVNFGVVNMSFDVLLGTFE